MVILTAPRFVSRAFSEGVFCCAIRIDDGPYVRPRASSRRDGIANLRFLVAADSQVASEFSAKHTEPSIGVFFELSLPTKSASN